jgi:hypothetical protein
MVIDTSIIYESRNNLVLFLVVLTSARASSRAVCLPPGNWGSSHLCGNIAKCGGNNIQQKNCGKVKNKKGKPPGRETQGAVVRQDWYKDYWPGTS